MTRIDHIARFIELSPSNEGTCRYLHIQYFPYNSMYELPYHARAYYNKHYLNVYDYMQPELEHVARQKRPFEVVDHLQYNL